MRSLARTAPFVITIAVVGAGAGFPAQEPSAAPAVPIERPSDGAYPIDLAAALRLAGAASSDVQIARARLAAAEAGALSAVSRLFPAVTVGAAWRRHAGLAQDVAGNIVEADKGLYSADAGVVLQVDLGEGIYDTLAARQVRAAAEHGLESERQDALARSAQAYLDLLVAQAQEAVAADALATSRDYESQLHRAVEAGIALKGEELRVTVAARRNELALQQAQEQRGILSARLAEVLRLEAGTTLVAKDAELVPLSLVDLAATGAALVAEALGRRPEVSRGQALVRAADETRKAALFGPLVPTLAGQAVFGGLDGGRDGGPTASGGARDYAIALGWRLGPGGILDRGRIRLARARLDEAGWQLEKLKDGIAREVIEARTRALSQGRQLETARQALGEADEALRLARGRRQFEVGVVLENILAEQDETRAHTDYVRAIGEYAKAQYALARALGRLGEPAPPSTAVPGS